MNDTINLTQALIRRASVTPNDAGCQQLLTELLQPLGFNCEQIDVEDVKNLWAVHGTQGPLLVFAGHTDVVPVGAIEKWKYDPFAATIDGDYLYGRGAADMKGSIAAFTVAAMQFIKDYPNYGGQIGFLITSDEEGPAKFGTKAVMQELAQRNQFIDMCIVGEPSSTQNAADIIKVGRRGSLHGKLTIHGKQGHIAYPHLADNPIHKIGPVINALSQHEWDKGNENFDPTSLQISNIHSGDGTTNIIPADVKIVFNFRYAPVSTQQSLMDKTHTLLDELKVNYSLEWELSGVPFETKRGKFIDKITCAIEETLGYTPELSTSGGTSDGRFIAPTGTELVELGPLNTTIHQVNENVKIDDLEKINQCYYAILKKIFIDTELK